MNNEVAKVVKFQEASFQLGYMYMIKNAHIYHDMYYTSKDISCGPLSTTLSGYLTLWLIFFQFSIEWFIAICQFNFMVYPSFIHYQNYFNILQLPNHLPVVFIKLSMYLL